jgi:hypothetical protein
MTNKPKIPTCVIVDDEDREYLEAMGKWCIHSHGYCVRNGPWDPVTKKRGNFIRMHRVVLERKLGRPIAPGMVCDHIDMKPLNCSRSNLREVTIQQNSMNTRARGYYWSKALNKWRAYIKVNGKQIHLGYFDLEADARAAYLAAKAIYHKIP